MDVCDQPRDSATNRKSVPKAWIMRVDLPELCGHKMATNWYLEDHSLAPRLSR